MSSTNQTNRAAAEANSEGDCVLYTDHLAAQEAAIAAARAEWEREREVELQERVAAAVKEIRAQDWESLASDVDEVISDEQAIDIIMAELRREM